MSNNESVTVDTAEIEPVAEPTTGGGSIDKKLDHPSACTVTITSGGKPFRKYTFENPISVQAANYEPGQVINEENVFQVLVTMNPNAKNSDVVYDEDGEPVWEMEDEQ